MAREYNVDDILEEIRRKKENQSRPAQERDTYSDGRGDLPARRPTKPEEERRPRRTAAEPARRPAADEPRRSSLQSRAEQSPLSDRRSSRYEAPEEGTKAARPRYEAPEEGTKAARPRYEEPEAPAQSRRGGFSFSAPQEPDADAEDAFELPLWDEAVSSDEAFEPELPLEEEARTDSPRPRAFQGTDDFTREIDSRGRRGGEGLVQSKWKQSYAEQEALEASQPEDDFASPADAPFVEKELKSIRTGLNVKLFFLGIFTFVSLYLAMSLKPQAFAQKLGVPNGLLFLPAFMLPEENMRVFLIVNLVLCVLAAIFCSSIVGGGMAALCRMRANCDSPAALAMLAVLIQGAVLAVLPDSVYGSEHISLYFCVALAALSFNLIGKKMLISRVERNFRFLTGDKEKYAFLQIKNREFAREFSRGLGPDVDQVAYSPKADFLTGFLDKSYSSDYSENFACFAVPASLLGALVVAVVTFFVGGKSLPLSISAFAAVLCVCAPFTSAMVPNLMLKKLSKKLTKRGAMLAGYESAEDLSETDAVILSDKDLFFADHIMIHGMKVFAEKRIDEAILDAASVIISCDGIMSGVFLNMVGGNRRMLKKVDSLLYEDEMGISAWVDGKRVLIGSRDLMKTHDIDCPSKDFEARYIRDGRKVLYIANSGELSAMFVVSYNPDPDTAALLAELQRRGISAIVHTTDPNVTADLIAMTFGVKRTSVKILPAKLHAEHAFLMKPKARVAAGGAHSGGIGGVLELLNAASAVRRSVMNGAVAQVIGVVAGYGLVAFMAFTNSLKLASYGTLLLYGLGWYVITAMVCSVTKK